MAFSLHVESEGKAEWAWGFNCQGGLFGIQASPFHYLDHLRASLARLRASLARLRASLAHLRHTHDPQPGPSASTTPAEGNILFHDVLIIHIS